MVDPLVGGRVNLLFGCVDFGISCLVDLPLKCQNIGCLLVWLMLHNTRAVLQTQCVTSGTRVSHCRNDQEWGWFVKLQHLDLFDKCLVFRPVARNGLLPTVRRFVVAPYSLYVVCLCGVESDSDQCVDVTGSVFESNHQSAA